MRLTVILLAIALGLTSWGLYIEHLRAEQLLSIVTSYVAIGDRVTVAMEFCDQLVNGPH